MDTIPIQSRKRNRYFYDSLEKKMVLCHPVMFHLLELAREGKDLDDWISRLGDEVTDRCGLACGYCGYGKLYNDYDKRDNSDMNMETVRSILDYLVEFWNSPLNLSHDRNIYIGFYGGEPLLNFPLLRETVDYVNGMKVRHNRFTFSITTNGLLLYKYMDFLVQNEFNVLISLDGDETSIFYNGDNRAFFEENVYVDREAIANKRPQLKTIYINGSVNRSNFGKLTILPNGRVHANVNSPGLGILGKDSIYDILTKEMTTGRSWWKIRRHVTPCKSCVFEKLCPPLSDYNTALGRNNLCHIY